jgi:hypothetical protein
MPMAAVPSTVERGEERGEAQRGHDDPDHLKHRRQAVERVAGVVDANHEKLIHAQHVLDSAKQKPSTPAVTSPDAIR